MNTEQKCDKCLAHNIGANHTCDPLMRALKENYDKKHGHTEQKVWRESFQQTFPSKMATVIDDFGSQLKPDIEASIERTLQEEREEMLRKAQIFDNSEATIRGVPFEKLYVIPVALIKDTKI